MADRRAVAVMVLFTACGNDNSGDTVLTGFSGVLIFGIIVWIAYRYIRRKT